MQSKAANKTPGSLRSFPTACKVACQSIEMFLGKAREYGEDAKVKGANRASSPQFPPFFSCSRFLNSAGPTMSEPGTGYKSTVYAQCIFVVIGSLFLNIRLHSILNNKKKKSEKKRSLNRR